MGFREERLRQIAQAIRPGCSAAIFMHVGADADSIGTGLALKRTLEKRGCTARLFTDSRIADRFCFLAGSDTLALYEGAGDPEEYFRSCFPEGKADFAILEDCSVPERIGRCARLLPFCARQAVIDHHYSEQCAEGLCCIDPTASATAELLYDLIAQFEELDGAGLFDGEIAGNIIAAIYFDTGGLRFSNTGPRAFGIAADLFTRFRIDIRSISYNLFEKMSVSGIRILAKAYSSVTFHAQGRIAICPITRKMIEECGADDDDMDGIGNSLRNVEGVDVGFVLREKGDNEIRVNIRSSEAFDAASFAAEYGGGGHQRAAGLTLGGMSIEDAFRLIAGKSEERLLGRREQEDG